ncbi:hypothetical protein HPB49_023154 [Dermacentor silvarum]|uniref:Uncharacterized protein n=1 Tax=Dermacentor silvarum TaxID=543639 RepID=A0ACB8D8P2_DERSI|nr:hypothetical protein HPB49_023154 [Dermacentor silvarum]
MDWQRRLEAANPIQTERIVPEDGGHVTDILNPMMRTLWLVGLLPRDPHKVQATLAASRFSEDARRIREEPLRRKLLRGSPMLFVVFGYLLHFSAATVYNVTHSGGFFGFFANCGYVLRNLFAGITLIHFLTTQNELIRLLEDSRHLRQFLPASKARQVRIFSVVTVLFAALSWLGLWAATAYAGFGDLQRYFDYYLYKGDVTNGTIPRRLGYAFAFLDATAYSTMTHSLTLLLGFHVCAAVYLRALAADYAAGVASAQPWKTGASQLKGLRWRLLFVSELLRRFDRLGSPVVFCWYLNAVGNLVLSVPGILVGLGSASASDYLYMLTDLLANLAAFVALTLALSEPARIVRDSHRAALWLAASGVPGAQALADAAQSAPVSLSGWDCFHVHRGMVLGVFATVSTYVIVVYQFIQDAV